MYYKRTADVQRSFIVDSGGLSKPVSSHVMLQNGFNGKIGLFVQVDVSICVNLDHRS